MNIIEIESEECLKKFYNIIDYMSTVANNYGDEVINNMIVDYEQSYNRNFNTDYAIHMYSYLQYINITQALFIYDNLDINCRDIYIRAIHERHDHLKEIIVVHETIKLIERCPDSDFLN